MKIFLQSLILLAAIICSAASENARLDVSGENKVILRPLTKPDGGHCKRAGWLGDNQKYYIYSEGADLSSCEWTDFKMSFMPENSGTIKISILGPYVKKEGKLIPNWIYWKDIVVEGAEPAGKDWKISEKNRFTENGGQCFKVWHNAPGWRTYNVTAGQEVIVAAKVKKHADPDYPVSLKSVANRGFKDDVAGDGRGGWSDQGGPMRDMRGFDYCRRMYDGIQFDVVDPDKNNGKAVVSFDSKYDKSGVNDITLTVPEKAAGCRYLYLLHSSCWNNKKMGTEVGDIKITYADGKVRNLPVRAQIDIFDWARAENGRNSKAFKCRNADDDIDKALFLSCFDLGTGKKRSLNISSAGNIVWIIVGASLSDRQVTYASSKRVFRADKVWKAVDMSDVVVKKGSALDFSRLVESGPAGKHGRVVAGKNGILAFDDNLNKEIRFAATGNILSGIRNVKDKEKRRKMIRDYISQVKIQGYNLIRYWADINSVLNTKKSLEFDDQGLDDMDYFIAEAKKNGIYAFVDIASYGLYQKDPWGETMKNRNEIKARMTVGDPEVRHWWEVGVKKILNHVNPYTETVWKDEKAIVFIDFYNEQEMGQAFVLKKDIDKLGPDCKKLFIRKWHEFLERRYSSPEKLANAWKYPELASKNFTDMPMPKMPLVSLTGRGVIDNDYWLFLMHLQHENMKWYYSIVRSAGYKGLCSSMNMIGDFKDGAVRSEFSELVIANKYFAHPSSFTQVGSRCSQDSSLDSYADLPRSLCSARLWDRPFFISEWNHAFWNQYQHEAGLLNPAYFALQGFYGAQAHACAVVPYIGKRGMTDFSIGRSPIGRANEFLSSCLFMRGDVRRSPHRVKLVVDKNYLMTGCNAARAVHSDQSKVALVCGFGLDYQGFSKPAGAVSEPAAEITLTPVEGATSSTTGWTSDSIESKGKGERLKTVFNLLREKGILSKGNMTDPLNGIFQSDTGEILLNCRERRIEVRTKRSEGVTINPGRKVTLGVLEVITCSEPGMIALCSVDDNALEVSSRMVLICSTFAVNSNMELSSNLMTMMKKGDVPVLMKTVFADLNIKTKSLKQCKLYALGFNGSRREEIPVHFSKGKLNIKLNTATLKNGPTPFFEVVFE